MRWHWDTANALNNSINNNKIHRNAVWVALIATLAVDNCSYYVQMVIVIVVTMVAVAAAASAAAAINIYGDIYFRSFAIRIPRTWSN